MSVGIILQDSAAGRDIDEVAGRFLSPKGEAFVWSMALRSSVPRAAYCICTLAAAACRKSVNMTR